MQVINLQHSLFANFNRENFVCGFELSNEKTSSCNIFHFDNVV